MFRALLRSKYSSLLVIVQIALTMAIMTNAIAVCWDRYQHMDRSSGIDEANSFYLTSSGFTADFNPRVSIEADLRLIRATPGVIDAVQTNSLPLTGSGNWYELQTSPGEGVNKVPTAGYKFDEHGIPTFDLSLVAGENFSPQEPLWLGESDSQWPAQVILSQATASALFGANNWQQAVGQTIYVNTASPLVVKGIVERLHAPWVEWPYVENTMISPARVTHNSARYVIRTQIDRRDELMQSLTHSLSQSNPRRVIRKVHSIESAKQQIYAADIATVSILVVVMAVLTLVTAMGIAGLASFNIHKRRRQIGIRRALGASRANILHYFLAENLMLSATGVLLGAVLSIGLNMLLVHLYALAPLEAAYLPLGMLLLVLIGQLAVLWPAAKAMGISPALATRAV
jgi:putative ABC transport system permease protein